MHYRLFDHTADLGVEVFGKTRKDLFVNAAAALFDLLLDAPGIQPTVVREIVIEGSEITDLFVNYLREILYLFNGTAFVLTDGRVRQIDNHHLVAEIRCGRFDARKHRIRTEIKAVTYHQASVRKTAQGWMGRIIFDV
jgi:SHS2 domain-containing protein